MQSSGVWNFMGLNFSSVKMEATCSSEMPVLIRPAWRHIPEDGILQHGNSSMVCSKSLAARGCGQRRPFVTDFEKYR
jgi:hypothetical protein